MNGLDVVTVCCIHCHQLLVRERRVIKYGEDTRRYVLFVGMSWLYFITLVIFFKGWSMSIPPHCAWGRAIKHGEDTPTNKICRRAPRAAHERDPGTNEIVESRHGLALLFLVPTVLFKKIRGAAARSLRTSFAISKIIHGSRTVTAPPYALCHKWPCHEPDLTRTFVGGRFKI